MIKKIKVMLGILCKFYKNCEYYTNDNYVCNEIGGNYYGFGHPAGCYRNLLEKEKSKT